MISPNECRHPEVFPMVDSTVDVTCSDCGRRFFVDDGITQVWSDPGDPGYGLPHRPPKDLKPTFLPPGYDVHLASMGMSISIDPLMPPGTFILSAHGLGPKYFDARTGEELTREQYLALPCGYEGWTFDPDERLALTIERSTDG